MYTCNCGKEFKTQNGLNRHSGFCNLYVKKLQPSKYKISENLFTCECGKEFQKAQSLNAHLRHCLIHRNGKPINKPFGESERWNKGLNKETDKRVKKLSKTLTDGYKSGKIIPSFKGKHHTKETLDILSLKRIKYLENNPHVKWYNANNGVKDIKVQGLWEKNVAEWLNKQNIKWDRITLNYDKTHRYTPDFYLTELNEYLEVKGWMKDRDKEKMHKVIKEHDIKIKMLYKKDYKNLNNLLLSSLIYFK